MSAFQIMLIAILAGMAAFLALAIAGRRIGRPAGFLWLTVVLLGLLAAIAPDRTTILAQRLGISRGTDLIVYLLVLAVLQGFLIFYLRIRRMRRELTLLVRRLAILEAPTNVVPDESAAPDATRGETTA